MPTYREIRADFDRDSVVVYQAYGDSIADPSVAAKRFAPPFSWGRMTWIKPSFLWLMERSNWGKKSGQERILAVRIRRSRWDRALSLGVLTSYSPEIHSGQEQWREQFEAAKVHVQWDPERSMDGKKLQHRAIQVGVSRHLIREYTDDWILDLSDVTPLTRKIKAALTSGNRRRAKELLPAEKAYPVEAAVARRLRIG